MSRRVDHSLSRRRRRRSFIWVFGVAALVVGLLYWEQVELLYLLSVLSLSGFLLVIAFSDLDRGGRKAVASAQEESEPAAVDSGATTIPATAAPRRNAKRRLKGAA